MRFKMLIFGEVREVDQIDYSELPTTGFVWVLSIGTNRGMRWDRLTRSEAEEGLAVVCTHGIVTTENRCRECDNLASL